MGFDNECILNIQSLPGEYFCPYCRTLVYPNEALQAQCTHLYCKPCLAYVVATTRSCPYDGYLVTEADSKPLIESNKTLAETIGKVGVHCLYHRSGCPWQGGLSDCITHCVECSFGNSPVICNRCGTQIMHRQVQEHGQTCPGVQSQAQQLEGQAQDQKAQGQAVAPNQSSTTSGPATSSVMTTNATTTTPVPAAPAPAAAAAAAAAPAPAPAITAAATGQGVSQVNTAAYPQAVAQAPTPEQWYQQQLQYQQYYQQYHGYDPYQQQYQQYAQYQQQAYAQYGQPQMQVAPQQVIQGQQPQPYMLTQTYPQPQAQAQAQAQPQVQLVPQQQPQAYPVPQPQTQPQPVSQPQLLAQTVPQPQQQAQVPPQQQHPLQSQMQPAIQPQTHAQYPLQAQQHHIPVQQSHQHAPPQAHPPPQSQVTGQQLLPPQPQHPQPQPHQVPPQQLQAPPQHQQPVPAQQHPHGQMQHLQQQPYPQHQQQPRPQSHPHPQPQLQTPPSQAQPHPMSQPQSFPQPQNQNPLAHAVTGHQSYPQPQPQQIPAGVPQQRPMQVPPHQQHSQHPPQSQNQFPPQQPTQMRPSHAHQVPMQVQQQPAAMPQGPHANLHPTQQQALRPGQQLAQQIAQHPAMQTHAQQQGLPQQQMHVQLHQGQPHFQGGFPSQQVHPQQALHSQGQAYRQQQIPVQPQLQQNAMSAMPNHQGQLVPARPMMPPQNSIHQPPAGQTGVNQHSPQSRATARPALSTELKPGSMLQNQLTQSDNHGHMVPASPASHPGAESKNLITAQIKRSDSVELNNLNSGNSSKSVDNEVVAADAKEKDIQEANNNAKDATGSVMQGHGSHSLETHGKEKIVENPEFELPKEEGATESVFEGAENLHASEGSHGQTQTSVAETTENPSKRAEVIDSHSHHLPDDSGMVQSKVDLNKGAKADLLRSVPLKSNQVVPSQGQISGATAHNMQNQPQHMLHQQINHDLPAHGTPSSQFTGHPNGLQDMSSAGPIHGQERYPVQPNLLGHPPRIPDPATLTQRPPAPERMMFPEQVPHSGPSQGRRLPDHPQQVPLHGQQLALRAPAPNFPEMLPPQGQPSVMPDPFQTPGGKQSHGPWGPEVPHPHLPGTEPAAALARGQPQFGHSQHSFEERAMSHPLQNLNHMAPSHDGRPRNFAGEPLDRQLMSRLPPPPRGPPFGPEGQMGIIPHNSVETEGYASKRPGLETRLHENRPARVEHAPVGQSPFDQSGAVVMNGSMHNTEFSQGLPKERFGAPPAERFKPFPEEGFNLQSDERFRTSGLESGARVVNRREFEEDLKQFPRPAHLDDNVTPFGSTKSFGGVPYGSDGGSHSLGSRPVGRPMPSGTHEDIGRRNDTTPFDRRMDSQPPFRSPHREYGISSSRYGSGTRPHFGDFNGRELHEFGDHSKPFNLPPDSVGNVLHDSKISRPLSPGLPGYIRRSDHDGPGNLRMTGQKGPGGLLDPPRKDMDGPEILTSRFGHVEPLGHGFSSNLRGGEFSPRNRHGHLRFGESFGQGNLRMTDPAGPGQFPSNLHIAEKTGGGHMGGPFNPVEPGFGSGLPKSFDSGFRQGDMDSFSRIRMPGSMGWCRICKIDCETVEGLDLHSQTREHQKMAMNMVLSIKQENAKRQKLSVGSLPFEDPNRMRKPSFENRIK